MWSDCLWLGGWANWSYVDMFMVLSVIAVIINIIVHRRSCCCHHQSGGNIHNI